MRIIEFEPVATPLAGRPSAPVELTLSKDLLTATSQALQAGSTGDVEALALWAGTAIGQAEAQITQLIVPDVIAERLRLEVPLTERLAVAQHLRKTGTRTFADLHTHEHEAFLSPVDRSRPFSARNGFYAIVAPNFSRGPAGEGWRCYEAIAGDWREVDPDERFHGWGL